MSRPPTNALTMNSRANFIEPLPSDTSPVCRDGPSFGGPYRNSPLVAAERGGAPGAPGGAPGSHIRSVESPDLQRGRRSIIVDLVLDLHRFEAPLASRSIMRCRLSSRLHDTAKAAAGT